MNADRLALLILVGFIFLGLTYSASTPIFEAPDEAAHFLYAHNIIEENALPLMTNRAEVLASLSWQRHQPPLLYMTSALFIRWIDRSDVQEYLRVNPLAVQGDVSLNNLNTQLHTYAVPTGGTLTAVRVMRLLCLMLAASTLWFIYRTGRLVSGQPLVGCLAMLLVAVMPTFVFIGASINNDNLVTFLYSAGVYWLVERWYMRRISIRQAVVLGLIAGGVALSKYQGLPFIGLAGGVLLIGALVGRWTWRDAGVGLSGLALGVLLLAGWWYVRNLQLYGDLMAIQTTRSIWGRGPVTTDLGARLIEFAGVWRSMWYMLGYLNIPGPAWLYPWVTLVSGAGLIAGIMVYVRRRRWFAALLLPTVIVLLWVTLYFSTGQINTSQGRFLFPSLVAFAPLVATGLYSLLRQRSMLILLPLVLVTLLTPADLLRAYRPLEVVASLPDGAISVDREAEGLRLVGYRLQTPVVSPDGLVEVDVYFQGQHPDDPSLTIAALDPISFAPLGQAEFYPGIAAVSTLDPAQLYRVRAVLQLNATPYSPRKLELLFQWRVIDPTDTRQGRLLTWNDGGYSALLPGPLLQDTAYVLPDAAAPADIRFGDAIQLTGYTLPDSLMLKPGETLPITLFWQSLSTQPDDLRLAFGLLNAADQILIQSDGYPAGLPSPAWLPGLRFTDSRELLIPEDATPGSYRLYLAWYRSRDNERLPLVGMEGNLYMGLPAVEVIP
ncbi:MAG: hypothetical protein J0M33_17610 [Anaerolineae bacterium]|nr:hypothetical protein [Anaerolineae bacterium]